jgi:uncharacterized membrane protein YjjP (DUF1212 family)
MKQVIIYFVVVGSAMIASALLGGQISDSSITFITGLGIVVALTPEKDEPGGPDYHE